MLRPFHSFGAEVPKGADGAALTQLGILYLKGYVEEVVFLLTPIDSHWCLLIRLGVEENNSTALSLFMKGAQNGAPQAQRALGHCYLRGECGVTANQQEGMKYLTEAAGQEDPEALYNLGQLH